MEPRQAIATLRRQIASRIIGNPQAIEQVLVSLLAGGHILLESPPGLGKTEMSKTLAESMDLGFKRIQCTPDLAPEDILGSSRVDRDAGLRLFNKGPIFTNLLLVDEINRAQPKTQSAFLEAMAERSVTCLGQTYRLPEPFMVVATQNPVECDGTHRLPEAQLDRFLLKARMTYLGCEEEKSAVRTALNKPKAERIFSSQEVVSLQRQVADEVRLEERIMDYIVALVSGTRHRREVMVGASTRAAVLFTQAAKASAYLHERTFVDDEDVRALAHPVLRHRLLMNPDASNFGYTSDDLIDDLLRKVRV